VGGKTEARAELVAATKEMPGLVPASTALAALDAGGTFQLAYTPEVVRPWGDAEALQQALDRFAVTATTMGTVRAAYQSQVLTLLGAVGKGPLRSPTAQPVKVCA